jgi:hypothetical protein
LAARLSAYDAAPDMEPQGWKCEKGTFCTAFSYSREGLVPVDKWGYGVQGHNKNCNGTLTPLYAGEARHGKS